MPGGSPYITAATLLARPAGISWTIVPTLTANSAQQTAQIQQACWNATSTVDGYCRQPLRATINTEMGTGPGQPRVSVNRASNVATLITRRWPVTDIAAIQTSQACYFPPVWTLIPAGQYRPRHPVITSSGPAAVTTPTGGNVIDVGPCYINWDYGRGGWDVMTSYTSGYPHAGLTGPAIATAETLAVDDVTAWGDGWAGVIYDGVNTEPVQVTTAAATTPVTLPGVGGTVQAGAGTLTLSSPLSFPHAAGTIVSAIPAEALRGVVLAATVEALEGINAIATQSLSGMTAGGTGALTATYRAILDKYRAIA